MKKLTSKLLLATLICSMTLTGCGKTSEPTSKEETNKKETAQASIEPASQEKPEITFYHGYFQDDWQPAVEMRKIYQDFADKNKDKFTLNIVALDSGQQGVYDRAIQEIATGKFPNIVDVGGMNIVPAAKEAGVVVDLKPYIDKDVEFKKGIGINYDQNLVDGKIYTVREQLETIGFWYNEALFNKVGATTPDKWKNWNDFIESASKFTQAVGVESPYTLNQGWPTSILLTGNLISTPEGRDLFNGEVKDFNNNAFKDSLNFLQKDALKLLDPAHFTAAESEKYREDFLEGKTPMLFNGVWESGSFADPNLKIKLDDIKPAVFPTSEEGKTSAIISASPGYLISNQQSPEAIEASVEFVKYMTSTETAKTIFEKVLAMPAAEGFDYDEYINNSTDPSMKKLAEACKLAADATYKVKAMGTAWGNDIVGGIEGKYAGLKDGSKTSDEVASELNSLLP